MQGTQYAPKRSILCRGAFCGSSTLSSTQHHDLQAFKIYERVCVCQWGLDARKTVFRGLRISQAQTSLRIRAVRSAPLLFAFWQVSYLGLLQAKFQTSR